MLQQFFVMSAFSASIFMLVALGFTLIFGIMRVVNFAHGEFVMLGAYGVYVAQRLLGVNYVLALCLAAAATGILGIICERIIFRRFKGNELGGMIVAIALAITLKGAVTAIFGVEGPPLDRPISGVISMAGAVFPKDKLFATGMALALILAVYFVLNRSRLGLAMRAVAQDDEIARLQGITPRLTYPAAFGIGCLLAGFAGGVVAPIYSIEPYMGESAITKAFVVVVLGGLGSIPGTIAAAILLGMVDAGVSLLVDSTAATLASFALVVAFLVVKPNGLFGHPS
ncbi:branched-chain amino acid ABC transporter permease [Bradyrhizobium sp.]|uniref:branched-chain amino acid ABC transporter permease n=1 Tax=Bradyrhizobium sp. TaxID=376 RepID=UPI0039E50AF6